MNGERAYLRDQLFQTLRNEYRTVETGWHFFSGLRFAILSVTATIQFGLFGAYVYALTRVEDDKLGDLGNAALLVIPAFGVIATYITLIIEWRARLLYAICLARGVSIEEELGIPEGHFRQIGREPRSLFYLYLIRLLYGLLAIAWLVLLGRGIVFYLA